MKTWKLIRIYRVAAGTKREAWVKFGQALTADRLDELKAVEFVVEDKPIGLWKTIWRQVTG